MEAIKYSKNVEFDVIYDDGTRKRVTEGMLFGVENEAIFLHSGTIRKSVIFATMESCFKILCDLELVDEFDMYLKARGLVEEAADE